MIKKGSVYVYDYDDDNKVDIGIVISSKGKMGESTESFWLSSLDPFYTDMSNPNYTNIAPSLLGRWE